MNKGKLYLIPSPLGETAFEHLFPPFNSTLIHSLDYFIVEEFKTGRRFIKKMGMPKPIDQLHFFLLNEHTRPKEVEALLEPLLSGFNMGLLSEAGTPCVADPGSLVVSKAQQMGIEVIPLIGPNSILLALMGSGLNGQKFVFNGYLNRDRKLREKELKFYESLVFKTDQTQIFIEAPYRNNHFFESMLEVCSPELKICLGVDLTTDQQLLQTRTVSQWRKEKIDLHKRPTVFLMGK